MPLKTEYKVIENSTFDEGDSYGWTTLTRILNEHVADGAEFVAFLDSYHVLVKVRV